MYDQVNPKDILILMQLNVAVYYWPVVSELVRELIIFAGSAGFVHSGVTAPPE